MLRRSDAALLCALLILVVALAAGHPTDSDPFADARAFIQRAIRDHEIPSVAVAVAHNGRIVFAEGFGFADLDRRVPATPRTMYSLASISKPMTATALMRLVEQGRVDLDRPANDYLGEAKIHGRTWDATGATVRRVLSHTAGLPLHYEFFYEGEEHAARTTDDGIARYAILIAPPGEIYQYSNLGYGIIDRILERVHGRAYADIMRTEVFEPLGMTRTVVSTGAGLHDSVAVRYGRDNRPVPPYDFDHRGGSAIYSSALDLARFGMFHLGSLRHLRGRILADSTVRAMQRPITPDPTDQGYGLGWIYLASDNGYRRIAHTGGMPGVATALYLYPEQNVVVVVLTNRSNSVVGTIAQELAGVVLPGYAAAARARERRTDSAAAQPRPQPRDAPPPLVEDTAPTFSSALLGEWSGTLYTPDDSSALHLLLQPDGDVHVRLGDELRTLLNNVTMPAADALAGRFAGTLPDEHARRHAHSVLLYLRRRGDRLSGQATAQTTGWPVYFALTSYVELKRVSPR